jgi:hypothetical protein
MLLCSNSLDNIKAYDVWVGNSRGGLQGGAKSFVCVGLLTNVSVRLDRSNTKPHFIQYLFGIFFVFNTIYAQIKCYFEYELVIQIAKSQPYYIFSV